MLSRNESLACQKTSFFKFLRGFSSTIGVRRGGSGKSHRGSTARCTSRSTRREDRFLGQGRPPAESAPPTCSEGSCRRERAYRPRRGTRRPPQWRLRTSAQRRLRSEGPRHRAPAPPGPASGCRSSAAQRRTSGLRFPPSEVPRKSSSASRASGRDHVFPHRCSVRSVSSPQNRCRSPAYSRGSPP